MAKSAAAASVPELDCTLSGVTVEEIGAALAELEAAGRVSPVDRKGLRFRARADSQYAVPRNRLA